MDRLILSIGFVLAVASGVLAYQRFGSHGEGLLFDFRQFRQYDENGDLSRLRMDADGDFTIDFWGFAESGRVVRIDIDTDRDGIADQRTLIGPDGTSTVHPIDRNGTVIPDNAPSPLNP